MNREITRALTKVKRRLRMGRLAFCVGVSLPVAALACLGLRVASFFTPIAEVPRLMAFAAGAVLALGVLSGLLSPIPRRRVAREADKRGLKERLLTLMDERPRDAAMDALLERDALQSLASFSPKAIPVRFPRVSLIAAPALALAVALSFIPNPQDAVLRERAQTRADIDAQAEMLEKAAESAADPAMNEEETRELRKLMRELADDLREAEDRSEALTELSKAQDRIETLSREALSRNIAESMERLSDAQTASSLAELLEGAGKNASSSELQAQMLASAGACQACANAASAEALANAMQSLSQLSSMLGSNSSRLSCANLNALMQAARGGLGQGGGSGGGLSMARGQGAGTGAGLGTTNQDAGYSEGQQTATGGGKGHEERVGAYESVYDPTRLGGDSQASLVESERGEGQSDQIELGPGAGDLSGYIPYDRVAAEYREQAVNAAARDDLPTGAREWVERYFDALIR